MENYNKEAHDFLNDNLQNIERFEILNSSANVFMKDGTVVEFNASNEGELYTEITIRNNRLGLTLNK